MTELYAFMGEHPWLTFFLALIAGQIAVWPFRLVNRYIRHRNIKAAGWPPKHLDADGDAIEEEEAA
jgi:hypothetical protein